MPNAKSMRMMNPVAVRSSSLAQLAYDRRAAILQVKFCDGTAYQYAGVPLRTYHDLLRANSKGAFFNHYIRRRFPHVALPTTAPITSERSI
jgi:KTSC domain